MYLHEGGGDTSLRAESHAAFGLGGKAGLLAEISFVEVRL